MTEKQIGETEERAWTDYTLFERLNLMFYIRFNFFKYKYIKYILAPLLLMLGPPLVLCQH